MSIKKFVEKTLLNDTKQRIKIDLALLKYPQILKFSSQNKLTFHIQPIF
jgi:hypothetical protein